MIPVVAIWIAPVGKEASDPEPVEAGMIDEFEEVLTTYGRDDREQLGSSLGTLSIEEGKRLTRYSRRKICYIRSGRSGRAVGSA